MYISTSIPIVMDFHYQIRSRLWYSFVLSLDDQLFFLLQILYNGERNLERICHDIRRS